MKSLFNKYIWLQLILSILLLFGGALIVAFAISGKEQILQDGLNIIAAVILFLFGGFAILASFVFESDRVFTNGLLYGSACIALGVFLCTREFILLTYLVYLLAIFFIVVGSIELLRAVILLVKKYPNKVVTVLTFVFAAIFIAGGILALIFRDKVGLVFCVIAGVLLFIAGVFELIFGIKGMIEQNRSRGAVSKKASHKKEKVEKPTPEAEPEPEEEQPAIEQQEIKELDYTAEDK